MQYIYEHNIQYYETDKMGIVHHSNYIRWFEEARGFAMERAGASYITIEELGYVSPVLSVEVQYKNMMRYGQTAKIIVEITKFNGVKMEVAYKVLDKETNMMCCEGKTSHCFLDGKHKVISLKKEQYDIYQRLLEMVD